MTAARHAVIIITANSNFAKLVLPCLTGLAIGMTTNLADIAPIFPVFRPSLLAGSSRVCALSIRASDQESGVRQRSIRKIEWS